MILTMGASAFAATPMQQRAEVLMQKMKSADVSKMTLPELKQGLKELRFNLQSLRSDLELAELKADGRRAVKVRNGIALGAGGLAILAIASDIAFYSRSPDFGGGVMSAILFSALGGVLVVGTQGYIYLTNTELHQIQNAISMTEKKIGRIALKIDQREANQ